MRATFALLLRVSQALGLALGLASGVLSPSVADAQAPSRAAVRELLSGFEASASAGEWAALGEGTVPVLVALFDDAHEPQPVRLRAVWAARFFPTSASRSFLERVALDGTQEGMVVRGALESLAFAFGESSVPVLVRLASHADVAVREGAIRALGRIGGAEARHALEGRAASEPDPALRALVADTLRALTH